MSVLESIRNFEIISVCSKYVRLHIYSKSGCKLSDNYELTFLINFGIIYRKQVKRPNVENNEATLEEDIAHHIPMAIILPQFPHLAEIYLNFGMIYMNDGFEWRDFE